MLFNDEAFAQIPGQLAMSTKPLRKRTVFEPCAHHAAAYASVGRERRAEVFVEGGWASSPCPGKRCQMKPGTDYYNAAFVAANPVYKVENED